MKTEDQIKALAELDGWSNLKYGVYGSGAPERSPLWHGTPPTRKSGILSCKNYHHSYDAIVPLIKKQGAIVKQWTHNWNFGDFHYDKTPAQLCESLLRATGKWKDYPCQKSNPPTPPPASL